MDDILSSTGQRHSRVKSARRIQTMEMQTETNSKAHHPDDLLQSLRMCDQDVFPVIHCLLTITVVIPMSTATPERRVSALRLLKTYHRSRTRKKRLNGLAQIYKHSIEKVGIDDVIERFASLKKIRIIL